MDSQLIKENLRDRYHKLRKIGLSIIAGVEYQGKIYGSTREINGLFQLDPITQEMTFLKRFCKEKYELAVYRNAFLYKNEMWLIPGRGSYITVVNLDTLDMDYYEIPFKRINGQALLQSKGIYSSVYSSGGMIADRYLYLIPANIDTLLIIDLETRRFYPYYGSTRPQEFFISGVYAMRDIYMLSSKRDGLIKVDLETKERMRYPFHCFCKICKGLIYYDRKIWSVSNHGDYIFNIDLDTRKSQKLICSSSLNEMIMCHEIFLVENEIFILPSSGKEIWIYNIDNGKTRNMELSQGYLKNENIMLRKIHLGKRIILDAPKKKALLIYDKEQNLYQEIGLNIDKKVLLDRLQQEEASLNMDEFLCSGRYKEGFLDIKDFVRQVMAQDSKEEKQYGDIKGNIWDAVKI